MTRKVAVVGNASLVVDAAIGAQVVDVMRAYGGDVVFLTRGVAGFEQFVAAAAITLGLRCFAYKGRGGRDNFEAWDDLVRDADEVIALIDPETLDLVAKTGTGRFVEKALAAGRPVRAATIVGGNLVWANEW